MHSTTSRSISDFTDNSINVKTKTDRVKVYHLVLLLFTEKHDDIIQTYVDD